MRIETIEITNYKAFLGKYKFNIKGKNVFIYGENGSGKSSLYYALKDFFQSSIENIDLGELENIFVAKKDIGSAEVKVVFKTDNGKHTYKWNTDENATRSATDKRIFEGNKLKSFLTYKHLLSIHHLSKDDEIDLFDMLVKGVLKHFRYTLTGSKELIELWNEVEEAIEKDTTRQFDSRKKRALVNNVIDTFNNAFGELFKPDSPEYILKHAGPLLEYFGHNTEIRLQYIDVKANENYSGLEGGEVRVKLKYAGREISKPHLFLNEARLSAIAISIYLGMIKRHIQGIPCKVLFLDDIFVGLDISNRLPMLRLLEEEFTNYQVFITTYDKPWFEYAKAHLSGKGDWKTMAFYSQEFADGTSVPVVFDADQDLLSKARNHLQDNDYKAAAVYARSAFEKIIRKYCVDAKKKIVFKSSNKNYTTEDFWKEVNKDLEKELIIRVEDYRPLIINTFSHYNIEHHEIKGELKEAIRTITDLKQSLRKLTSS